MCCCVLALGSAAIPAGAQTPPAAPLATDSGQARRLSIVRSTAIGHLGDYVRLASATESPVEGRLVNSVDTVFLNSAGRRVPITRIAVDSMWVRRNHAGRYALICGALSGLALQALAKDYAQGISLSDYSHPKVGAQWGAFAVGAGIGGLLGAVAGSFEHEWQRIYP
jgi:hypothetical protein